MIEEELTTNISHTYCVQPPHKGADFEKLTYRQKINKDGRTVLDMSGFNILELYMWSPNGQLSMIDSKLKLVLESPQFNNIILIDAMFCDLIAIESLTTSSRDNNYIAVLHNFQKALRPDRIKNVGYELVLYLTNNCSDDCEIVTECYVSRNDDEIRRNSETISMDCLYHGIQSKQINLQPGHTTIDLLSYDYKNPNKKLALTDLVINDPSDSDIGWLNGTLSLSKSKRTVDKLSGRYRHECSVAKSMYYIKIGIGYLDRGHLPGHGGFEAIDKNSTLTLINPSNKCILLNVNMIYVDILHYEGEFVRPGQLPYYIYDDGYSPNGIANTIHTHIESSFKPYISSTTHSSLIELRYINRPYIYLESSPEPEPEYEPYHMVGPEHEPYHVVGPEPETYHAVGPEPWFDGDHTPPNLSWLNIELKIIVQQMMSCYIRKPIRDTCCIDQVEIPKYGYYMECSQCQKPYGLDSIISWWKKSLTCPHCRYRYVNDDIDQALTVYRNCNLWQDLCNSLFHL